MAIKQKQNQVKGKIFSHCSICKSFSKWSFLEAINFKNTKCMCLIYAHTNYKKGSANILPLAVMQCSAEKEKYSLWFKSVKLFFYIKKTTEVDS